MKNALSILKSPVALILFVLLGVILIFDAIPAIIDGIINFLQLTFRWDNEDYYELFFNVVGALIRLIVPAWFVLSLIFLIDKIRDKREDILNGEEDFLAPLSLAAIIVQIIIIILLFTVSAFAEGWLSAESTIYYLIKSIIIISFATLTYYAAKDSKE